MKSSEKQHDNNIFNPCFNAIDTPVNHPYSCVLLTDFLYDEYPPHIVANSLLTVYFELTEYLLTDSEKAGSETMQESIYVLRRLYEVIQETGQQAAAPKGDNGEYIPDAWDALISVFMRENRLSDMHKRHIEKDFPQWVVDSFVEKLDVIEKQKEEIGSLHACIETLKRQLAAKAQTRNNKAVN